MIHSKHYGRIFYGLGVVGIGLLHFFFKGFRPIIMPVPTESVANISILVYLIAIYILVSGLLICINKKTRDVSLLLGVVFFFFLIAGHLPVRLQNYPEIRGAWIDAIKILALSGGAFLMASAYPQAPPNKFFDALYKVAPVGKYFFAIMLLLFGYGHMVSAVKISGLVPKYIPWPVFWTYIGGIALIGSAISFVIKFKVEIVALLLSLVLFIWLISLHLYYAIHFPEFQDGENIIGSFECLAFCGIALVISSLAARAQKVGSPVEIRV
ncbi:hypothetical protein LXM25_03450 [Dyadobacter sp. LJ53]|uniref:hypothetical protein n=1 Tax=Dyadobacter chenwenxiniae TaxID=2906456 RepID=UPI001F1922FB|nr:hypothetical protein [Dyadobacter chenwenxiniae]MCF0049099.1 hypothetical protein [Dyadobacter chenwenxiniae]